MKTGIDGTTHQRQFRGKRSTSISEWLHPKANFDPSFMKEIDDLNCNGFKN
jgi:hypothetical protein